MALTEDQKADFFREGYIVVRDLLTENELATLRERYTALVTGQVATYPSKHVSVREVEGRAAHGKAHRPPDREASIRQGPHHDRRGTQVYPRGEDDFVDQRQTPVENPIDAVTKVNLPSRYDNAFEEIVRSPKVVDVIEDLMGPNIKLYYDQVFAKPPFDKANRYHQDSVFWKFFASNFQITCQVLLDDATTDNGCVRVIPGSHRFGLIDWDHLPHILTEDLLEQEVALPLNAGDATFHHSLTLHCSGPNRKPTRRRGWSIHYVSADTRYIGSPEETDKVKELDILVGPEPVNGWPLIRGREFPHCI
tara:strand:+ start:2980 stop:3900 length:921 start_codon:yes stop_codon:yes gene_type:complete